MPFSDNLDSLTALVPAPPGAVLHDADGTRRAPLRDARAIFESGEALVAHAGFVAGRLGTKGLNTPYDVIELFAFVRPG